MALCTNTPCDMTTIWQECVYVCEKERERDIYIWPPRTTRKNSLFTHTMRHDAQPAGMCVCVCEREICLYLYGRHALLFTATHCNTLQHTAAHKMWHMTHNWQECVYVCVCERDTCIWPPCATRKKKIIIHIHYWDMTHDWQECVYVCEICIYIYIYMAAVRHSKKITIQTHYDTWRTTGRNVCMCVRYIYRASCLFRLMTMRHIKPMRRSHSTWRILMGHDSFLLYYVPLARTLTDAQECVKRHGIRLYIVLDHVK